MMEAARINEVDTVVYAASSSCYGIPDEYPTKETASASSIPICMTNASANGSQCIG